MTTQTYKTDTEDLFAWQRRHRFETATAGDQKELQEACHKVWLLMRDYAWHSRVEITDAAGQLEGMRRMQDLKTLGYKIEKRSHGRTFEYRLVDERYQPGPVTPPKD